MLEETPSGHLAIPCSIFLGAVPETGGESAAETFTYVSAGSSSQHETEADRGQASQACQDTGEYNHEALSRFMDQAVDGAVTMMGSSARDHWY
eukprot:4124348-Pyramimonas_sp.AAC.1